MRRPLFRPARCTFHSTRAPRALPWKLALSRFSLSLSDKVIGDNEACYSLIGRRYAGSDTKVDDLSHLHLQLTRPWQISLPIISRPRPSVWLRPAACTYEHVPIQGTIKKHAARKASAPSVNLGSSSSIQSRRLIRPSVRPSASVIRVCLDGDGGHDPATASPLSSFRLYPLSLSLLLSLSPMIRSFMRQ